MRSSKVGRLIVVGAILALPLAVSAQEAAVSGTMTDGTGGVLPGVTITAIHEASGNTFLAVSGERGGIPDPAACRRLPTDGGAAGIFHHHPRRPGGAGRTAGRDRFAVVARHRAGVSHGHGRGTAARCHAVESRQQHRPSSDVGAAGAWTKLDVADAPGAWRAVERRRGDACGYAGRYRQFSAQSRRPASDADPCACRSTSRWFAASAFRRTRQRRMRKPSPTPPRGWR